MLIVITGAAYSGRFTMEKEIAKVVPFAGRVPVQTTDAEAAARLGYVAVEPSVFEKRAEAGAYLVWATCGENNLYAVAERDLLGAVSTQRVSTLVCNANSAATIGRYTRRLEIPALCVYMYCPVRTALGRMALHENKHRLHEMIQDIYDDHARHCGRLFQESEAGQGFTKIVSVNSESVPVEDYLRAILAERPANPLVPIVQGLRSGETIQPGVHNAD